uniref:Uncharacterized protein n=1 Tax=Burkholderia sp. (strain CCGE1003) TaxID=640512 RepID=E1T9T9_BURSG
MRCFNSMAAASCFGKIATTCLTSDGNPACDARRAGAFLNGGAS